MLQCSSLVFDNLLTVNSVGGSPTSNVYRHSLFSCLLYSK